MAGVREDACEIKIRGIGEQPRNFHRCGRVRFNADAMRAAVDFEEDIESNARLPGGLVQPTNSFRVVRQKVQLYAAFGNFNRLPELSGFYRDGVGDIPESVFPKRFRLGQRGNRDRSVMTFGLNPSLASS